MKDCSLLSRHGLQLAILPPFSSPHPLWMWEEGKREAITVTEIPCRHCFDDSSSKTRRSKVDGKQREREEKEAKKGKLSKNKCECCCCKRERK